MKALVSLVLAVALVGGIYVATTTTGCGARAQVAGDKVLDKIDKWLGELDVKRKEIENSVQSLEEAVENNHKAKINAEVRLDDMDRRMQPIQKRVDGIKVYLAEINPHLSSTEAVEINGKTMSPEEIKARANEFLEAYEMNNQELGALQATKETYKRAFDLLNKEYQISTQQMATLKKKLEEIDIKKTALDDMKTAQTVLGKSGSISDKFNDLEVEINDLFIEVETEMRVESEKVAQREATLQTSNLAIDEILEKNKSSEETQARIDAILNDAPDAKDPQDK
ncbi:MAG: hypothetical protein P8J91_11990 [Pirellulaceae bacterium]|nr:hypothetical protein [Pirellulaceae bacterium]MDG2104460.1 hypothetical protein [Pirellulaceae bacterium]